MRTSFAVIALTLAGSGCVSKTKYAEIQNQLDGCRNRLEKAREGEGGGGGGGGARAGVRTELQKQLQGLIDRGVLEIEDADGRTTVAMKAEVLFPSGSAELSPAGRETVAEVARALARQTDANWQVEGHTDDQPITGQANYDNWNLGADRALAVLRVMLNNGMSADHVSAATFGEHAPVASNATEQGRAHNRRIEIALLPQVGTRKLRE
jgi:chemotaxis protein MotB